MFLCITVLAQKCSKSYINMENSRIRGKFVRSTDQQNPKLSLQSFESILGSGNISSEISRSHEIALYTTSADCTFIEPDLVLCSLSDLVKRHRIM